METTHILNALILHSFVNCVLGLYIAVITLVVTASIICTILISQIHHRGEVPIPYALRRFTFDLLASILCLRGLKISHGTAVSIPECHNKDTNVWSSRLYPSNSAARIKLLNGGSPTIHTAMHKDNECDSKSCCECQVEAELDKEGQRCSGLEITPNGKVLSSIDVRLQQIIESLGEYEKRRIEANTSDFRIAEWKAVGKVYDRFFFILFVLIMLIITTVFLLPSQGDDEISLDELKVNTARPTPTIT